MAANCLGQAERSVTMFLRVFTDRRSGPRHWKEYLHKFVVDSIIRDFEICLFAHCLFAQLRLEVKSNARDSILSALKRQIVPQSELPEVASGPWIEYEDRVSKFCEMVEFSGGRSHRVNSCSEVQSHLATYKEFCDAQLVFSAIEQIPGNVKLDNFAHPQELNPLDFVIYPGDFAVAENGAIWLTDRNLRHRVCFFITQYLVLVVSANRIVDNMHQAYERLKPPLESFGLFCAGPSKTADIEQSLVIGAHGCRGLEVFVVSENGGSQ